MVFGDGGASCELRVAEPFPSDLEMIMSKKTLEALVIGVALWVAGTVMIIIFGDASLFPSATVTIAFLTAPAMYVMTRFHLRDVLAEERPYVATLFGVVVTAVQFPLDALAWLSTFRLGYPPLTLAAREALIFALEIAYFWLLVVPWWTGKTREE